MKVLVTGAQGLVGTRLVSYLRAKGHDVSPLTRKKTSPECIVWQPEEGKIERDKMEGFGAVVHLAGDNIASGRWTEGKKASIRDSRLKGTELLCKTIASLERQPEVIVSASAIGYYGDRCDEILTEGSEKGSGFLADLCRDWEAATAPAREKSIRVALLRIGVVLSPDGGALAKMLPPFLMGAGGPLGSGKQYMSWIGIDDLSAIINHIMTSSKLDGPINAVAPNPVTNSQFSSALGAALSRPAFMPAPGFAVRMLLGEMADELLLSSQRVQPKKLEESGFKFKNAEVAPLLKQLLRAG